MSWVAAESDRHYARTTSLRRGLARRAAVAIDNAELHSQTRAAAVQLQQAVLPEVVPAFRWQVASHYALRAHGGRRRLLRRVPPRRRRSSPSSAT